MKPENKSKAWAIVTLMFLAPFIGECFPLFSRFGDITNYWYLLEIILLYGLGILILRETSLRWFKGTPNLPVLILLGLAFGLFIEGLLSFSLFIPNWMAIKFHIIRFYGRGTYINWGWLIYALIYHSLVTIPVTILLLHRTYPHIANQPWISKTGLIILIFAFFGISLQRFIRSIFYYDYIPPIWLLILVIGIIIGLLYTGFELRRNYSQEQRDKVNQHYLSLQTQIDSLSFRIIWNPMKYLLIGFSFGCSLLFVSLFPALKNWPFFMMILLVCVFLGITGTLAVIIQKHKWLLGNFQLKEQTLCALGVFISLFINLCLFGDLFSEIFYFYTAMVFISIFFIKWS